MDGHELLALKPARLSAFSGLPATPDAKANARTFRETEEKDRRYAAHRLRRSH
jgi:hypothetical protein